MNLQDRKAALTRAHQMVRRYTRDLAALPANTHPLKLGFARIFVQAWEEEVELLKKEIAAEEGPVIVFNTDDGTILPEAIGTLRREVEERRREWEDAYSNPPKGRPVYRATPGCDRGCAKCDIRCAVIAGELWDAIRKLEQAEREAAAHA